MANLEAYFAGKPLPYAVVERRLAGWSVPQLVGIADDIDRGDPLAVDRHAHGLVEFAVADRAGRRSPPLIIAGSMRMSWPAFLSARPMKKRAILVGAHDRVERRRFAAAAIGDRNRVLAQQFGQARNIAACQRLRRMRSAGGRDCPALPRARGVRRAPHGGPASPVAGKLPRSDRAWRAISANGVSKTSCSRNAARSIGDSRSSASSNANERSSASSVAASGRKAFRVADRLGQPGPDIDFTLDLGALQPVEAKPRHDGDEKGLGIVDVLARRRSGDRHPARCLPRRCGCRACDRQARAGARDGAPADRRQAACLMTSTLCPSTVTRRHSLA